MTNGRSVSVPLSRLGGPALAWDDAFHEGPVPLLPRAELLRARAGFLSECGWGGESAIREDLERRDLTLTQALEHEQHVVFRFEHDLYDQTAMTLFEASQDLEEAPFEGDAWVWRRLSLVGAGYTPLVSRPDGRPLPGAPPSGDRPAFVKAEVALTDAGRAVLAGEADRIELLGIDRWLGGTHLRPDNVWRRTAEGRIFPAEEV